MGTNSALLTRKVIENTYEVETILWLSLLQAVDYLKCENRLSTKTAKAYRSLRNIVPAFSDDGPIYEKLQSIQDFIKNNDSK